MDLFRRILHSFKEQNPQNEAPFIFSRPDPKAFNPPPTSSFQDLKPPSIFSVQNSIPSKSVPCQKSIPLPSVATFRPSDVPPRPLVNFATYPPPNRPIYKDIRGTILSDEVHLSLYGRSRVINYEPHSKLNPVMEKNRQKRIRQKEAERRKLLEQERNPQTIYPVSSPGNHRIEAIVDLARKEDESSRASKRKTYIKLGDPSVKYFDIQLTPKTKTRFNYFSKFFKKDDESQESIETQYQPLGKRKSESNHQENDRKIRSIYRESSVYEDEIAIMTKKIAFNAAKVLTQKTVHKGETVSSARKRPRPSGRYGLSSEDEEDALASPAVPLNEPTERKIKKKRPSGWYGLSSSDEESDTEHVSAPPHTEDVKLSKDVVKEPKVSLPPPAAIQLQSISKESLNVNEAKESYIESKVFLPPSATAGLQTIPEESPVVNEAKESCVEMQLANQEANKSVEPVLDSGIMKQNPAPSTGYTRFDLFKRDNSIDDDEELRALIEKKYKEWEREISGDVLRLDDIVEDDTIHQFSYVQSEDGSKTIMAIVV